MEIKEFNKVVNRVIETSEEAGTSIETIKVKDLSISYLTDEVKTVNKLPLNDSKGKEAVKVVLRCPIEKFTAGIANSDAEEEFLLIDGFDDVVITDYGISLLTPNEKYSSNMQELREGDLYGLFYFDDYKINAKEGFVLGETLDIVIDVKSAQHPDLVIDIYYKD